MKYRPKINILGAGIPRLEVSWSVFWTESPPDPETLYVNFLIIYQCGLQDNVTDLVFGQSAAEFHQTKQNDQPRKVRFDYQMTVVSIQYNAVMICNIMH